MEFQYTTFGSIKISGKEIFTGSLAGSQPEMTIFDLMGDFSETGEVNGVPAPSSRYLGKKLPFGDATVRRKKTTQLLKILSYSLIHERCKSF